MSFSDPSAIILIVGATAVLAFVIHGLWFSGRPMNRRLSRTDKRDEQLRQDNKVSKVRIVTDDKLPPRYDQNIQPVSQPRNYGTDNYAARPDLNAAGIKPAGIQPAESAPAGIEPGIQLPPLDEGCQLNIVAPVNQPYRGEDLEAFFKKYGFIRGQNNMFYVFEDYVHCADEVFRILPFDQSVQYQFPPRMQGYRLQVLTLFMALPQPGKAFEYFESARAAATQYIIPELGGQLCDTYGKKISSQYLDALAKRFKAYDQGRIQVASAKM